jgi:hypothetical protein
MRLSRLSRSFRPATALQISTWNNVAGAELATGAAFAAHTRRRLPAMVLVAEAATPVGLSPSSLRSSPPGL